MSAAPSEIAPERRGGRTALPASALRTLKAPGTATFAAGAGAVAILGFARGGYYATTWSWATIVALAVATTALRASRTHYLSRLEWQLLGGLAVFAACVAVGAARAGSATRGVPVLERTVLYVTVVWAALQLVRRATVNAALGGMLTGIVAVLGSGLTALLLPTTVHSDRFEGRLLFLPIGYANACGILAAIGVLLALGFIGHAAASAQRVLAAASLVPLVVSLDLTGSRGAAVAGAAGLAAALILDDGRRTAAAAALFLPLPLVAAAVASHSRVADAQATSGLVARDGKIVAVAVIVLSAAQAAIALRLCGVLERERVRLYARRGLAAVAALGALVAVYKGLGGTLGDRPSYWRAAWSDARDHPLLGSGPGSFAAEWLRRRAVPVGVLNAHNLYLETLAELGSVGVLLLLTALVAPIAALRRTHSAASAAAAGAYVAFLVHAAVDWDWQIPVVTATGLLCGVSVLASTRQATSGGTRRRCRFDAAAICSALVALAAGAAGVGSETLAAASHLERTGSWAAAARLARVAEVWQPWSADPPRVLGAIYLAAGDRRRARRSFERAVQRDPRDASGWYGLARVGNPAEQRSAVAHLAQLDPLAVHLIPNPRVLPDLPWSSAD